MVGSDAHGAAPALPIIRRAVDEMVGCQGVRTFALTLFVWIVVCKVHYGLTQVGDLSHYGGFYRLLYSSGRSALATDRLLGGRTSDKASCVETVEVASSILT